jgi:UDP-N-acetylmuramoyl-tripeptide--D-alanyl-D-alanine ligase
MNITELYRIFLKTRKVSTDTRSDLEGSLFFALKGASFDGNTFVEQALAQGAVCCVIDNSDYYMGEKTILVDDVLKTLQQLATFHREQLDIPILAITGTNGKTTTKELVNAVLSTTYKTTCTKGNLNNHIGVPLTLLSMSDEDEVAIIEMGANHPQEIDFLCHIAKPNLGVITNIGKAHLEGFGGFEGVVKTKNELYQYIKQHEGTLFVNRDDSLLMELSKNIKKITYGTSLDSECSGRISDMKPFLSLAVELDGTEYEINSKLIGAYNAPNILTAACIGNHFHVPAEKIKTALESYQPDNMRSQMETIGGNTIILDAYNANPTSMNAALDNFFTLDFPRKAVILGNMLELGTWSEEEHQKIINKLKNSDIDNVFLVGEHFKQLEEKSSGFRYFGDVDALIRFLECNEIFDTLILVKGSRSVRLEKILDTLKSRQ